MASESLSPKTPHSSEISAAKPQSLLTRRGIFGNNFGDNVFYWGTLLFSSAVLVLALVIGWSLWTAAHPAVKEYGLGFVRSSAWNPVTDQYGAWPYVWGTLMSSFLALLLAVPVGIGCAIFLAELAPKWMRTPLSFTVELLAAVPSVVYGLWGRLVLVPWLQDGPQDWLSNVGYEKLSNLETSLVKLTGLKAFSTYGLSHFVDGAPTGQSMMAGGLILAIMILPFITAISREVIKAVPPTQREAAFGLGATRWEAIRNPVLKYARSGIIGAVILGLARALGETMAITMVIGNGDKATASLLSPANTLSSKIALQFAEASDKQLAALMYLALVLFGITIIVNAFARALIWNMSRSVRGASRE